MGPAPTVGPVTEHACAGRHGPVAGRDADRVHRAAPPPASAPAPTPARPSSGPGATGAGAAPAPAPQPPSRTAPRGVHRGRRRAAQSAAPPTGHRALAAAAAAAAPAMHSTTGRWSSFLFSFLFSVFRNRTEHNYVVFSSTALLSPSSGFRIVSEYATDKRSLTEGFPGKCFKVHRYIRPDGSLSVFAKMSTN